MNVISLIQSIEANEERIEAERLEIEKLLISDGKSSLEQYVSELFACVDHEVTEPIYYRDGSKVPDVLIVFVRVSAPGFLPIYIYTSYNMYNAKSNGVFASAYAPNEHVRPNRESVDITNSGDLAKFLKRRRDGYIEKEEEKKVERERKEREAIESAIADLKLGFEIGAGRSGFYTDLSKAAKSLKQLIDIDSTRSKEWKGLFNNWWREFNDIYVPWLIEQEKKEEEKNRARDAYESDKVRYEIEYREYLDQYEAVMDRNKAKLGDLLASFDSNLTVYEIHYSVTSECDGERDTDVDVAYCLAPSLVAGFHRQIIPGGKLNHYSFCNIVKFSSVYDMKVSDLPGNLAGKVRLSPYVGMGHLVYSPVLDKGSVEDEIDSFLERLPLPPEDGLLSQYDISAIVSFVESGGEE